MKKIHKYSTTKNSKLILVKGYKFNAYDINNFNEKITQKLFKLTELSKIKLSLTIYLFVVEVIIFKTL